MSTHFSMDDDTRTYRFERTTGLPAGYFDRPRLLPTPDQWVCIVVALAGIALFFL